MAPEAELRVDPDRMLRDLRELEELTGGADGAQRLAWTETWDSARAWLIAKLDEIGVGHSLDEAHNLWAESPGAGPVIAVGSHLDSVPNGGWLDGALGVIAGLEVLRAAVLDGWAEATLRLIDWADEEGARFGYSTLGSSAAAGLLDPGEVRALTDASGQKLEEVLRGYGVELDRMGESRSRLADLDALLELHIEQGPVLETAEVALGIPAGAVEVRRFMVAFDGQAAHAGTTPMKLRRDAGLAAARLCLDIKAIAEARGALATCGSIQLTPGVATAVAERSETTVDLRSTSTAEMDELERQLREAVDRIAGQTSTSPRVSWLWSFPATSFDPELTEALTEAVSSIGPYETPVSGALHDAVAIARTPVPVAMLFVRSIGGISHNKIEDSLDEDLEDGLRAFAGAVEILAEQAGRRDPKSQ